MVPVVPVVVLPDVVLVEPVVPVRDALLPSEEPELCPSVLLLELTWIRLSTSFTPLQESAMS